MTAMPPDVHEWDAELFLRFEAERAWPAHDLVNKLTGEPGAIFDLGCGPGASTRLLAERFPEAEVTGIDSSSAMLARARRRPGRASFVQADISRWTPPRAPDLIFADSALQWVPDHEALFPRLMGEIAPGGTLAAQMPDNRQEPSHALMRLIAADGPWADRLVPIAKTRADDFKAEISHLEAVLDGKTESSPISLERGLDTMMVIAAAFKSHELGRRVSIDWKAGYRPDALR